MNIINWLRLYFIEQELYGTFGRYNRYRRWCLERNANAIAERLLIANEVLAGPGVNTMEAQANELFLRRHDAKRKPTSPPAKDAPIRKLEPHNL
jgi:hypothetical protein